MVQDTAAVSDDHRPALVCVTMTSEVDMVRQWREGGRQVRGEARLCLDVYCIRRGCMCTIQKMLTSACESVFAIMTGCHHTATWSPSRL